MKGNPRQGFVLSVTLHLSVAAGAVLLALLKPAQEPPITVFTLVTLPPPPADEAPVEPALEFTVPVVPVPPAPRPEPQRPPPERRPEPTPVRKPEPPKPQPPPPKPMSFEEFKQQHGDPKPQQVRQQAPKPVTAPRIDTKFSVNLRETIINLDRLAALTDAEQSVLDSYIARLREALRRAWDVPPGLARTTTATAEVLIAANGKLTDPRITQGSGNAAFDQAVLDAFATLGSAGPTPDGQPLRLRLPFRLEDR